MIELDELASFDGTKRLSGDKGFAHRVGADRTEEEHAKQIKQTYEDEKQAIELWVKYHNEFGYDGWIAQIRQLEDFNKGGEQIKEGFEDKGDWGIHYCGKFGCGSFDVEMKNKKISRILRDTFLWRVPEERIKRYYAKRILVFGTVNTLMDDPIGAIVYPNDLKRIIDTQIPRPMIYKGRSCFGVDAYGKPRPVYTFDMRSYKYFHLANLAREYTEELDRLGRYLGVIK